MRAAPDPGAAADPGRRVRAAQDAPDVALRADGWNTSGPLEEVARHARHPRPSTARDVGRDITTIEKTVSFPIIIRDDRAAAEAAYGALHGRTTASSTMGASVALLGAPTEVADAIRPYRELGFETVIVRMPAPYDRETIDRMAEVRELLDGVRVVALAGGTGGAKLADGLQAVLPPGDLTVVVNTGDDTERHGLLVMPDHDAVMYMLAGRFDFERGWGQAGETWAVMDGLAELRRGGLVPARRPRLRDAHRPDGTDPRGTRPDRGGAVRSRRPSGSATRILPMADGPVRTQVRTDEGWLDFQEYFVHLRQAPEVREVRFDGSTSSPTPQVVAAIEAADVVVIGPSNPIVSIGPILAGPIRALVDGARPVPASRSWRSARSSAASRSRARPTGCWSSLGHESSARGVARIYRDLATTRSSSTPSTPPLEPEIAALGLRTHVTDTIMADAAGRARLARAVLEFAGRP